MARTRTPGPPFNLAASAALIAAVLLPGACRPASFQDSNVILVSIDTLRADHIGAYGYPIATTPEIDLFARQSVLFEDCQSQSASTLASHASILTSEIMAHHGASFARELRLPDGIPTIAGVLRARGFKTASFNDGGQIAAQFGLGQGFDLYENLAGDLPMDKLTFDRIVRAATSWIDRNRGSRFFLFLHTYETHSPYTPRPETLAVFDPEYAGPLPPRISEELIGRINSGAVAVSPRDRTHIVAAYDAEIREMDGSFGELVRELEARRLLEDTIIVFTSDHGEEFGEHDLMATHSNTLFREQVHVPLIIRLPGGELGGRRAAGLVRSIDIAPTLLDLLRIEAPSSFEGTSLAPRLRNRKIPPPLFSISQRDMLETYRNDFWSITDGRWKLFNGRLYDLAADPGEIGDFASSRPDVADLLRRAAMRLLAPREGGTRAEPARLTEDLKKTLKALGYVK